MLCLGWLIGTPLTVLAAGLLFFLVFQRRAIGHGRLTPCNWTIRIVDQHGQPVPGVELVIRDGKRRLCPPIGNWHGPGSIYTDETGEATFSLPHGCPFGFRTLYLFGGYKKTIASDPPAIVMLYKEHDIFSIPLSAGQGVESLTVVVVRDLSKGLPPWIMEEQAPEGATCE